MKKSLASLFLFIFLGFLATPSIVTYIDKDANISGAFAANEEENSSKTGLTFEYTIQDSHPGYSILQIIQEQTLSNHFYKEKYRLVFLDVLSPPPKQA